MSLARWRWILGLRDPESPMTRRNLRDAMEALPQIPEAERMTTRTIYAQPDGREKISHVFRVMNFRKRRSA